MKRGLPDEKLKENPQDNKAKLVNIMQGASIKTYSKYSVAV